MIKDPVGADSDSEFARLLAPVRSAVSGYHATRDRERLYCYEWCWYAMTGQMPIERVTPEDLAIEALRQK